MNAMRSTTSTPSRAVPVLLAAVVASIVLGIIGMHALSTHGVIGSTGHSSMTSPETGHMTGTHGDMSAGQLTSPAPDSGDGHHMGAMVMLCLAMLVSTAAALILLLVGLRRRPRVWAHRPAIPSTVIRWVTARLGTGPPYVWQFSVIRC